MKATMRNILAVLLVLAVMLPMTAAFAETAVETADSVWMNGVIYTVDDEFSTATAMAIVGDRLVFVGDDEGVAAYIGDETEVYDLGGNVVIPGLIDSHAHISAIGQQQFSMNLFWAPKQVILDKVAAAAETAAPGEWIRGSGWIESVWPGQQFPTKEDLDAVAPNNPVYLSRADGHTCWVNSLALEIGGVTNETENPDGGYIYRDENGEATGILTDNAMGMISSNIPATTLDDVRKFLVAASDILVSYGFTSAMDAGTAPDRIDVYRDVIESGEFNIRADVELRISKFGDASTEYALANDPIFDELDNMLNVMAIKVSTDGAMGGRSAAMIQEYSDEPGKFGELMFTEEQFYEIAKAVYDRGYQLSTHSIGDAAVREVLNVYERIIAENDREDPRLRIEHFQSAQPEDMDRAIALGVLPSYHAIHATSDMLVAEQRWGAERMPNSYAWRTMLDKGAIIPNGSDAPVELVNPYHGLYASVTRMSRDEKPEGGWYPEQCMTREEALRSFTIWGAYGMFNEDITGSLEVGKLADFAVIDRDYMTCDAWEIMNIQALVTVLGGKIVYEKNTEIPTVSFEGVPVNYNYDPCMDENNEIFAPVDDMVNAMAGSRETADGMTTVTVGEASAELAVADVEGVDYVNVREFYEGLGYKTRYEEVSNTLSVGA